MWIPWTNIVAALVIVAASFAIMGCSKKRFVDPDVDSYDQNVDMEMASDHADSLVQLTVTTTGDDADEIVEGEGDEVEGEDEVEEEDEVEGEDEVEEEDEVAAGTFMVATMVTTGNRFSFRNRYFYYLLSKLLNFSTIIFHWFHCVKNEFVINQK
jgi:hypothetical protein